MKQNVNLLQLALESSLMLKGAHVLLVPFMIATLFSFFVYFSMFAGLDPEMFDNLNTFFESAEVQQMVLIGAAFYSVITVMAMGAASAMSLELVNKGSTSLGTARKFVTDRGASLLMLSIIMGLAIIVGLRLAIIPGLAAAFFLMYAPAVLVLENADPLEAIQKSYATVSANGRESFWLFISFALAYFVMNLVLMALIFIPVLGVLAAFFITCGYTAVLTLVMLRAYIALTSPTKE